ncbi:hypothetical protein QBC37DRAFT_135711 [Rhypophila decipiens]|uniref:Uncharacterized protein n=1 Tax=Rhypophila decipiens TaxID=261697 RepID=A0AAN6YNE4_9PEZI|nr:hypothetical protein QBC37DRAFT_135711 [Rhypophila decipiens]
MTASSYSKPMVPNMGALSQSNYSLGSLEADRAGSHQQQPMFKKHKVLPHPRKETPALHNVPRSLPQRLDFEIDSRASHSSASLDSVPSRSRRVTGEPELPPTPPAHSRKSSSTQSVHRPSPPQANSPLNSTENVQPPATPTNQQSPPTPNLTPERTPPGPATRATKPRPAFTDRLPSKVTIESRTESFRTAPENPYSSDDDDGRSTLRPKLSSAKTSQSTVRQMVNGDAKSRPQAVGLGLGLESSRGEDLTPRTTREFSTFDGEWGAAETGSGSEVEEEWDNNLGRNVVVRKRRPGHKLNGHRREVIEDMAVTPTNATRALRSMSLQESPIVYPSPRRVVSDRVPVQPAPSTSTSSFSTDLKRSSMLSTRSTVSTVVEAILVETMPQRRKTLRHVRKQPTLRESGSEYSPSSSAPTWASVSEAAPVENTGRRISNPRLGEAPRESYASNTTSASISSRKARREVWKNGGIPVVVVPDRQSSVKSSRTPSLRSTSSRRSKQSPSLSSAPLSQISKGKEYTTRAEAPRRSRTVSEADGSRRGDQRTIDYPPVVPKRSSSLSAPTSRNGSRTASLTAESLKAQNAIHAQQITQALQKANGALSESGDQNRRPEHGVTRVQKATKPERRDAPESHERHPPLEVRVQRAPSMESGRSHEGPCLRNGSDPKGLHSSHENHEDHRHHLSVDRYGDPFFGKRLDVQNTPFSQVSVDTNATSHAEVSEAMAVSIYPHQNKSLVVVEHSAKPSESSSLDRYKSVELETPTVRTNEPSENIIPVTPPQIFSMDDVDSPLRNPRAPPEPPAEPPAINFIPATPSGLTPMVEKERMLGNYFAMTDEKPAKPMSLLKRALTRRRNSEYGPSPARPVGFLTRTFSLTRSIRRGGDYLDGKRPARRHSIADDKPPDESRLHPHWRPAIWDESDSEESDWDDEEGPDGRTYKYPPIDNRPRPPLRSLSQRMKRTFAILPTRDDHEDEYYDTDEPDMPARRTIRRTPSGNLRVMKFRRSLQSLPRIELNDGRPYTAPEDIGGTKERAVLKFWRPSNVPFWMAARTGGGVPADGGARNRRRGDGSASGGGGFFPTLSEKMNLTRRFSERRREKRSQELKRMISGPRKVRDGVGDVIRRNSFHR